MLTWGDLIRFKRRIEAITRALTNRIKELVEQSREGKLGRRGKEELRFLNKVMRPPTDALSKGWNALIEKAARDE